MKQLNTNSAPLKAASIRLGHWCISIKVSVVTPRTHVTTETLIDIHQWGSFMWYLDPARSQLSMTGRSEPSHQSGAGPGTLKLAWPEVWPLEHLLYTLPIYLLLGGVS